MQLSKNFTLYEMISSATARELGISNYPTLTAQRALRQLCTQLLQPLRDALGAPIQINSGYRSARLNAAVGGVSTSRHLRGEAADCSIDGRAETLLGLLVELDLDFDQAILYRTENFLHLSLSVHNKNRKQLFEQT